MIRFLLAIIIFSTIIYSQFLPYTHKIDFESKFNKVQSSSAITPAGNSISDIVTSGDTILIGSNKGLSLSTDIGKVWTNFYKSNYFENESISALAFKHNIIYSATAHSVEKDGQVLPEGSGLKISTDFGNSWIITEQSVDHKDSNFVYFGKNKLSALPITTAVNNITYDLAISGNTIWTASFAGGLRKSTNLGKSWERVILPPDYLDSIKITDSLNFDLSPVSGSLGFESNLNHRVFSVFAQNDSTIWVGTANGINKTTDKGNSWTKFNHKNQGGNIGGNFVVALNGKLIQNNYYIFAATWKAEDTSEIYAISFSSNGGKSWETTNHNHKIHNIGFLDKYVYAAGADGLYKSNDLGKSWTLAPTIVDDVTKQRLRTNTFYSVNSQKNSILWAGSNDGLAYTTESGQPWTNPWRVFIAFVPVQSKNETYAYPNPFNPDVEICKIKYTTEGVDSKVTIRIYDFGMNLVRTVIQNAQRTAAIDKLIQQTDNWDGKNDSGTYVSNGVYFYSIEQGDNKAIWGKILVIR